eukprot:8983097-Alexandrium_andersonii.AAC.1
MPEFRTRLADDPGWISRCARQFSMLTTGRARGPPPGSQGSSRSNHHAGASRSSLGRLVEYLGLAKHPG